MPLRRVILRGLAPLCLAALLAWTPAAAQERVLNVFNWNDYIDPYVVQRFTRETGIRVRYDVFDSLETLEGRLSAGRSGYDIVVPTSEPTFSRLARAGAFRPLDRALVPNLANLDPELAARVATSDPGNRFGALYLWGTIGLGLNPERVRALAPDAPTDSLALLLDPQHARRLARCGITVLDSAIDVIPTVLRYLGKDPDSTSTDDLRRSEPARRLPVLRHSRHAPAPIGEPRMDLLGGTAYHGMPVWALRSGAVTARISPRRSSIRKHMPLPAVAGAGGRNGHLCQ